MTERHRRRHASLARMNCPAVVRRQQAEIEKIRFDIRRGEDFARGSGEAECLGDLARASAVVARGSTDDENA